MPTKQTRRCRFTDLTNYQADVLSEIAVRGQVPDNHRWPASTGITRSLVARGMLTTDHKVTTQGFVALGRCSWFSPRMRLVLAGLK